MTALTTTQKQRNRRQQLNAAAQKIGVPTWAQLETRVLRGEIKMTAPTVFQITSTTLGGYNETATEQQIRDCLEQMGPEYDPALLTTHWGIDDDKTIYDTLLYDGEEVAREVGH